MRQKYFINTFGVAGDITPAIPDAADTNGFVSYDIGFSFDYQRLLGTDPLAKPILRTNLNAILSDVTGAVQGLQQQGVPEFITAAQNGGTAYPYRLRALVAYSTAGTPPFQVYQNLVDSNTAVPGTDATWVLVKPEDYPLLDGTNTFTGTNTFEDPVTIPNGTASTHAINLGQLEWTAGAVSSVVGATIASGRMTINFPSQPSQQWSAGNVSSVVGAIVSGNALTIAGNNVAVFSIISGAVHVSVNGATPITASSWTVPTGITIAEAIVVAGGSGASGCSATVFAGASGAGGGWSIRTIAGLTPGAAIPVTVGTGGLGSAAATASIAGGTSSFGSYCSATGASQAANNGGNNNGAFGGTGTGGNVNGSGNDGSDGSPSTPSSQTFWPGISGCSLFQGARRCGLDVGSNGASPGAGGSAPYTLTGEVISGGAGAAGIVIVRY